MLKGLKRKFYSSETVLRQFGKYSDFNEKLMKDIGLRFTKLAYNNLNFDIEDLLDTSEINLNNFKDKKVVHISTWDTACGIAAYCRAIKEGFDEIGTFSQNVVIPINPAFVHHASYDENKDFYDSVVLQCSGYDYIIVQYEFGFFASDKYSFPKDVELFYNFINNLSLSYPDAKILIYIHTSLNVLGYKNAVDFLEISEKFSMLSELDNIFFMANTFNLITDWYSCGIKANLGIDPVKNFYKESLFVKPELKSEIQHKLDLKDGDVVIMMLGFINPMKRYDEMAEILAMLPSNYKFLAAGGIFPDSPKKYLKRFEMKIKSLNLSKRVYITGLFDDEDLGTYFNIADIMCAPYGKVRSGSGSIPMLLLPEKPIVAYKTDMIDMINSHCMYKPVVEVEFDNREDFSNKLLELTRNKEYYAECSQNVRNYSKIINNKKLALLILKALEDKCLRN